MNFYIIIDLKINSKFAIKFDYHLGNKGNKIKKNEFNRISKTEKKIIICSRPTHKY